MLTVLIVDDAAPKRERVTEVFREALGETNVTIDSARTTSEAASKLEATQYDLLVLDINLPLRRDSQPVRDGGLRLLKQLQQGGPRLKLPEHIIGLTEYPELYSDFARDFATHNWQVVQYAAESPWAEILTNKAIYISEHHRRRKGMSDTRSDIAIITALKPVELEAVLQLPGNWSELPLAGDNTVYHIGTFRRESKSLSVVAAAAIGMGMPAAACLSMKLIQHFRPRYLIMAGIAAGVGTKVGDILVADEVWDYGSGKLKTDTASGSGVFSPAPAYIPLDATIKERVDLFNLRRKSILDDIRRRWQAAPPEHTLSLHVGPVASGSAVIENKAAVESVVVHNRKLIGLEMETYGVFLASRLCVEPRPIAISAKSVCDFGVPPKTDEYQRYAAFTSATFVYEFALDQLSTLGE